MNYEKAYKEALERAKYLKENTDSIGALDVSTCFEEIFPELKESEDEKNNRIKKEIVDMLHYYHSKSPCFVPPQFSLEETLAWLEKQGENKSVEIPELVCPKCMKSFDACKDYPSYHNRINHICPHCGYDGDSTEFETSYKNHPIHSVTPSMIQWKGNNLKQVIEFTGKSPKFNEWFKSFEEYERYVHEHNNIFKLFNEDGSHYEVPVGAWIVKTPDDYNVASKAVLKQKPADKVKPKFKVGDWVIDSQDIVHQIANVIENVTNHTYGYDIVGGEYFNDETEGVRLWTIQDAEDGDVLATSAGAFIYNGNNDGGSCPGSYCGINTLGRFQTGVEHYWTGEKVYPAIKEQRDLLFQKMKEAGYEWDAEKKELRKIEMKPAEWSEEDEQNRKIINKAIWEYGGENGITQGEAGKLIQWLKSLKDKIQPQPKQEWSEEDIEKMVKKRALSSGTTVSEMTFYRQGIEDTIKSLKPNHWKPSEEQMRAFEHLVRSIGESGYASPYDNNTKLIYSLLNDLKKL